MKALIIALLSIHLVANERPFVTTHYQGQLGNQLFQTSAAVAYALDHDCDARFPTLINTINGPLNCKYIFHRLNLNGFPEDVFWEDYYDCHHPEGYVFRPIAINPSANVRFFEYFPSEKFFAHHEKYLKELYAPTGEILSSIYSKYSDLLQNETVAIHVRTFLPDGHDPVDGLGKTDWQYYINAINEFPEDCTFVIFSDAYEWVKMRFPKLRKNMHFVEGNPHYFDFYFMSLCDHQVISPKSTYSWWAAWLNNNPNKIVIAASNVEGWTHVGAYPDTWIQIPLHQ